jgi:hypothetical protein
MRLVFLVLLLPLLAFSQRVTRDTVYNIVTRDSFGLKVQVVRETSFDNGAKQINQSELIDSSEFVRRLFRDAQSSMLPVREAAKQLLLSDNNRKQFTDANRILQSVTGRNYNRLYRDQGFDKELEGIWTLQEQNRPDRALEYKDGRFRECLVNINQRAGTYKIRDYVVGGINDVPNTYNNDHLEFRVATGASGVFEFFYFQERPSIDPNKFRRVYADISQARGRARYTLTKRTEIDQDTPEGQIRLKAFQEQAQNRRP